MTEYSQVIIHRVYASSMGKHIMAMDNQARALDAININLEQGEIITAFKTGGAPTAPSMLERARPDMFFAALGVLERARPHWLIVDVMMLVGLGGIELCRHIHTRTETSQTPTTILPARDDPDINE